MAVLKRVVLGDLSHLLPMPDRGFQLFPRNPRGRVVNVEDPFWRRVLRDRSMKIHPTHPAPEDTPPVDDRAAPADEKPKRAATRTNNGDE